MKTSDQNTVIVLLLKLSTADVWLDANAQTSRTLAAAQVAVISSVFVTVKH